MAALDERLFQRQHHGAIGRNTLWSLLGQFMAICTQLAYFMLTTRTLGVVEYGAFSSTLALSGIVSQLVGLGCGDLVVKNVARDETRFAAYWGNGLILTALTGLGLGGLTILLSALALVPSISLGTITLVVLADCLFVQAHALSMRVYQAHQRLDKTAQLHILLGGLKLVFAGVFVVAVERADSYLWAWNYALSTGCAAVLSLVMVVGNYGKPSFYIATSEMIEGFFFSLTQVSRGMYESVDKVMLARLDGLAAAGVYTAGSRIALLSFVPMRALFMATYARFFKYGETGIGSNSTFALFLLPYILTGGVLIGVGLYAGASWLPWLLGAEYTSAIPVVRGLAILPLLSTIHYLAGNVLAGSGYQRLRSLVQLLMAVLNIALNFCLIPTYGVMGAIIASLIANGVMAVVLWAMVGWKRAQQRQSSI